MGNDGEPTSLESSPKTNRNQPAERIGSLHIEPTTGSLARRDAGEGRIPIKHIGDVDAERGVTQQRE
jgi:hypothetical protein